MKKFCKILCLASFALFTQSCSADDLLWFEIGDDLRFPSGRPLSAVLRGETLRILDIGNSYTEDGTELLPGIAEAAGVDMENVAYYRLVRGGASFLTWYNCYYDSDAAGYDYTKVLGGLSSATPEGTYVGGQRFRAVLEEPWDVIIVHQVSNYANDYSLWNTNSDGGYLPKLLGLLKERQPEAAFVFMAVHSYASDYKGNSEGSSFGRWQNIVKATSEMLEDYKIFKGVIPQGTAVQNLRASSWNDARDLTIDGTHLGRGLCRYAAACAVYQTLLAPRTGVDVLGNGFRYECLKEEWEKYPEGCIDVTDENAPVAQRAAMLACGDYLHVNSPE